MKSIFQISDCHLSDPSSFENLRKALLCAQMIHPAILSFSLVICVATLNLATTSLYSTS
ncbi:3',5'-cyclic-nucleotide phosphodiesterase [Vibrio sp. JCM 19052]|nr:3',5'-cyclic-nucleotide phosphodiesterase [Vibrio sp. JCM 19052]